MASQLSVARDVFYDADHITATASTSRTRNPCRRRCQPLPMVADIEARESVHADQARSVIAGTAVHDLSIAGMLLT